MRWFNTSPEDPSLFTQWQILACRYKGRVMLNRNQFYDGLLFAALIPRQLQQSTLPFPITTQLSTTRSADVNLRSKVSPTLNFRSALYPPQGPLSVDLRSAPRVRFNNFGCLREWSGIGKQRARILWGVPVETRTGRSSEGLISRAAPPAARTP